MSPPCIRPKLKNVWTRAHIKYPYGHSSIFILNVPPGLYIYQVPSLRIRFLGQWRETPSCDLGRSDPRRVPISLQTRTIVHTTICRDHHMVRPRCPGARLGWCRSTTGRLFGSREDVYNLGTLGTMPHIPRRRCSKFPVVDWHVARLALHPLDLFGSFKGA